MKFLVGTIVMVSFLILVFILGLMGANPGITMLAFCSFASFGNPLLWVAIFRTFTLVSRKYRVVAR
jgi:hypothetical protein